MTHDDFFSLTIDTDEITMDPKVLAEIDEHRRGCRECREVEADYHELRRMSRFVPGDVPCPVSAFEDRILAVAEERIEHDRRTQATQKGARRRFVATACLATLMFAGVQIGVSHAMASRGSSDLQLAFARMQKEPTVGVTPPRNIAPPSDIESGGNAKGDVTPRRPLPSSSFTIRSSGAGRDDTLEVQLTPEGALAVYRAIESDPRLSLETKAEASLAKAHCLVALNKLDMARAVAKDVRETLRGTERQRRLAAVLLEELEGR